MGKSETTTLKNEISAEMILMESTTARLLNKKRNNDMKDSTIKELNKKEGRVTEEKIEMKMENGKNILDLEFSKKLAEDEFLSEQEMAKETIQKLEESMSFQEQQRLSSTKVSNEFLEMEEKVNVTEKGLNDMKRFIQ